MDDFAAKVRGTTYTINQMQWQLFWSRLDMLAWRNEWNDADPKRCCTEQIRIDFRQMAGTERDAGGSCCTASTAIRGHGPRRDGSGARTSWSRSSGPPRSARG